MANQNYSFNFPVYDQYGLYYIWALAHSDVSKSSPRINGKLVLKPQPFTWQHHTLKSVSFSPPSMGRQAKGANNPPMVGDLPAAKSRAQSVSLAKFTSKVRKHNASLGVTFGTFRESRNMIMERTQKIAHIFEGVERSLTKLERDAKRGLPAAKRLLAMKRKRAAISGRASDYLEGQFGWVPLVQDIQQGFDTLANAPKQSRWVKAVHSVQHRVTQVSGSVGNQQVYETDCVVQATTSARVTVVSQNLELLNRLGLLNVAGVAWDLVPWSFVVNMFTNCKQIADSFTAFSGLVLSDGSVTTSVHGSCGYTASQSSPSGFVESVVLYGTKERTLGVATNLPSLQFRVPELDLGLASIAIALLTQRLSTINRILGPRLSNF